MPNYLLLLHSSTTAAPDLGPDEIQAIVERYMAWSESLRQRNALILGEKLSDSVGRVLSRDDERLVVKDGPYAEAREIVGGIYLIRAKDLEEAQAICADCPHLALGGTVELRQIEETPGGAS